MNRLRARLDRLGGHKRCLVCEPPESYELIFDESEDPQPEWCPECGKETTTVIYFPDDDRYVPPEPGGHTPLTHTPLPPDLQREGEAEDDWA